MELELHVQHHDDRGRGPCERGRRCGGNASAVAYGFRSLWAALQTGQVVRITPEHRRWSAPGDP